MEYKLELVYFTRKGSGIPGVILHELTRGSDGQVIKHREPFLAYKHEFRMASPVWRYVQTTDLAPTGQWVPVDFERSFLNDLGYPVSDLRRIPVYEIVKKLPYEPGQLSIPGLYSVGCYVVTPLSVYDKAFGAHKKIECAQIDQFSGRLLGMQQSIPTDHLLLVGSVHPLALTAGWFGPPERL